MNIAHCEKHGDYDADVWSHCPACSGGLQSSPGRLAAPAPSSTELMLTRMVGEMMAGTALTRLQSDVSAVLHEVRTYNENVHQLNLALGEFRARSIEPIKRELEFLRYNLGAKVEDVVTMMQKMVGALDKKLTDLGVTPAQKEEAGLHADRPQPQELTEKAIDSSALMAALERANALLETFTPITPGKVHALLQGETTWIWHQGCGCPMCEVQTAHIAAEQASESPLSGQAQALREKIDG
jgi:hypothetical protein